MKDPMTDAPYVIRPGQPADYPLIYNSWLKSYRDSPTVKSVPNTPYFAGHHEIIERLLPLSVIRVACDPGKPGEIFGYAVAQDLAQGRVLHWIYVKHPFRGFGLAKALESALQNDCVPIVAYSHRVKNMERLLGDRAWTYNPYALMK
jgi:hypothetical protein